MSSIKATVYLVTLLVEMLYMAVSHMP